MRCWRMRCWDIWRCWGPKKEEIELMEYEELVAITPSWEIKNELDKYPQEYYNKYLNEGHIYRSSIDNIDYLSDDWETYKFFELCTIFFENDTWTYRCSDN